MPTFTFNTVAIPRVPTRYFRPCDADFDGDADAADLAIFVQAGGWDWNGDGLTNAADFAAFAECVR